MLIVDATHGSGNPYANRSITVTTFTGVKSTRGQRKDSDLDGLVRLVSEAMPAPRKELSPMLRLVTSDGDSCTSGTPIDQVFGVVGDYDGGEMSVDEAVARLEAADLSAIVCTTASHTGDKPRWRVFAPLSTPTSPGAYGELLSLLNGALGGILAAESWQVRRRYFYGPVQGARFECRRVDGLPLDIVQLAADFDPIGPPAGVARAVRALYRSPAGGDDFDRRIVLDRVSDETMADVASALKWIDPDDYNSWINHAGLPLKSLAQAGREEQAHRLWHEFSAGSAKYDHDEAEVKWQGFNPGSVTYLSLFAIAQEHGWRNPRSSDASSATAATRLDRTDAGNAALLAEQTKGNLRYVPELRTWLVWAEQRWNRDTYGTMAQTAALEVAEHYFRKAAELRASARSQSLEASERKKLESAAEHLEKWGSHCRNRRTIDAMLAIARADGRFTLAAEMLDQDAHLFGVANGVVDLRTGALRPDGRDDFVTRRSPVPYNLTAPAPRFQQFIQEVMARPTSGAPGEHVARPALVAYLHRCLGYCLTALTGEQKMFFATGPGANGKNVLLDTVQWVMGSYCQTIPPEALMATRHDGDSERPSPTAASLAGARLAISSESKDGAQLDVALVKRHTGGGYMTARFMRENSFRFPITHKLMLMTNHRPALDHMDDAVRGRLHLIPFDMRWNRPGHPERNPTLPDGDKDLPAKLKAEAEGVLAWLVSGAVAYFKEGLEPPVEVINMTRDFFNEQDPLGRWLETCRKCEPRAGARASELFEAFGRWQIAEDEHGGPTSQTAFSLALKARGFAKVDTKEGVRYALQATT